MFYLLIAITRAKRTDEEIYDKQLRLFAKKMINFLCGSNFLQRIDLYYKNLGIYMINPIAIAVSAAKNTAPAAMSLINPIFS